MAKIVFITSRFPYPLDKGDKLRVFFQLKYLSEENEIHLITINEAKVSEEQLEHLQPFCKSIHTFKIPVYKRLFQMMLSPFKKIPFQVAYFYNPVVKDNILQLIRNIGPQIIHCHLIRTTEYVKSIQGIRKSLDFMDAFGKGMERRESIEKNPLKRLVFGYERKWVYKYEEQIFNCIDRFCIISDQDKNFIPGVRKHEIITIPNGVDFETFYPRKKDKKFDLVFMGNLGYPPNIHAIQFLVNEILPVVKAKFPKVSLLLAGVGAGPTIKGLQSDYVHLIEHFDDISESMAMSKIMVAPMTISIGLQNKIIQAMAMGMPCVVSRMANNAINAPHGKAIIEANTPTEFANSILDLLENENMATKMGVEAYHFVQEHFSWKVQNEKLNLLFGQNDCKPEEKLSNPLFF